MLEKPFSKSHDFELWMFYIYIYIYIAEPCSKLTSY